MLRRNQEGLKIANILSDLLLIAIACLFAWRIRYDVLDGIVSVEASGSSMALMIAAFSAVSVFLLYVANIYAPQRLRKAGVRVESLAMIASMDDGEIKFR